MSESQHHQVRDSDKMERGLLASHHSRAAYESLVNTLPLCLLIKDQDGCRIFANDAYLKFRGARRDDVIGKTDRDLFPADIAEQFMADDRRVMESGEVLQDVEETLDATGRRCWIERVKSPILDPDDRVIGVQLVFWEVTDRVLAERELEHERDLLRNLLQHIPDSIYFKDRESRFLRVSDAMARKFGLPNPDAALGKTDADIFSGEHAEAARRDELRVMESGHPLVNRIEKETWHEREDTWCMSTKMPFLDNDGQVIGTFGISRDVTDLIKFQQELKEARDAADRANQAKSDFLANMSHEIRTPMNAVIGMSELLAQTELTDEQRDYVELVRDSADSLLRLLNDILDFSKIEARKLELEAVPFSVRDLIEKSARTLAVRAAESGLELACRVEPEIHDCWFGDPVRLRQILINLIGNAVKFTDAGEVVVEVAQDGSAPDRSGTPETESGIERLRFSVRDTGIGIPADKQAMVLEAFTQADSSTTRRFGGTGLGLAITRQLVELMQGLLELESEVGVGTRFFFTLPLKRAPAIDHGSDDMQKLARLPVLVVDDNATNRRILDEILTKWQFEPTLADSGAAALRIMQNAAGQGKPFSLGILDCMMPNMDGFELAARIRDRYSADQIKLIILSSATRGDDIERCRQLQISRYITKPVVQSELLDTVLQVMGMQTQSPIESFDNIPACRPLRVLVAEDGLANQRVVIGMLRALGHQSVLVSNGRDAVSRWKSEPFDIILMDMHMPVMDGIEASREIRKAERERDEHIPIIAVTAAAMKEDAEACLNAGMDGFLTKPIQPRVLQKMLAGHAPSESVLEQTVADRGEEAPVVIAESNLADPPSLSDSDVIDLQAAASRVPGGLQGVRQLAEVFLPECDEIMKTLRSQIALGDAALIQRAAHTLKGSAGLFFADTVVAISFEIERSARNQDLADVSERMASLEGAVENMVAALRYFLKLTAPR